MAEKRDERRQAIRFRLGAPVTCVVMGTEFSFPANTVDVSLSGALLEKGAGKPPVGTDLTLWFSFFPGSSEIPVRARVVRLTETAFAVQFTALTARELAMLRVALPAGPR